VKRERENEREKIQISFITIRAQRWNSSCVRWKFGEHPVSLRTTISDIVSKVDVVVLCISLPVENQLFIDRTPKKGERQ
jgi:hypothetical protein